MKLQPFAMYLMMEERIVLEAVEVSGNQVMDTMICCTESVKVPLFSAVLMVKLLLSLERYSEFLLLIKVCILCVLSLTAFWVSVAVVENSFKRVTSFFDSILGVFRGDWETPFTVLCGGCLTRQFYVVAK